jgi:superfamily I DNA and RNA helicase
MLLGILQYEESWYIKSNAESGNGYSDILIETPERTGVVIELKYAGDGNLDKCCEEAMKQIEEKSYDSYLIDEGMDTIIKYGIAFYKKKCKVVHG